MENSHEVAVALVGKCSTCKSENFLFSLPACNRKKLYLYMLVGGRPSAEVRELWAVLLCQVTYYHVFTLQLIRLAKILRGVTGTLGMFLGMALNGMSLKELLAALGHSVDSNLLSDLQICHCNFHLSY